MKRLKVIILTLSFLMIFTSFIYAAPVNEPVATPDSHSYSSIEDVLRSLVGKEFYDMNRDEIVAVVEAIENNHPLTDYLVTWVRESLLKHVLSLDSIVNIEAMFGNVNIDYDELAAGNIEHVDQTDLGIVSVEKGHFLINFLVTSTKRTTKQHWDLGRFLYFDLIPKNSSENITIKYPVEHRMSFPFWYKLWELVPPGEQVPHIYSISTETLMWIYKDSSDGKPLPLEYIKQILTYPYARKYEPIIRMRADIDVFDPDKDPPLRGSFDQLEQITAQNIYDKTGVWFYDHAIDDMRTRFQDIEIPIPPLHVNVHHVAVVETDYAMKHSSARDIYIEDGKVYEVVGVIETKSKVLPDYEQILVNAFSGEFGIETPEGYKFLGSGVPSLMDPVHGPINLIRDVIGEPYMALPRVDNANTGYLKLSIPVRRVDILGDTDIYFYYEIDKLPDFEVVEIDPGVKYSHPDKTHTGTATFRLKDENKYEFPHEADIAIFRNGIKIFEKKNVIFEPGESKLYSFEWEGSNDTVTLCAEIWPSIPTISHPFPGVRAEDAYPEDNVLCKNVESEIVYLTVKIHPVISAGKTDPEPGVYKVKRDTWIPLSAEANPGWKFVQWSGDISTEDPDTHIFMNRSKTAVAEFSREKYRLVIEVRPFDGGRTSPKMGVYYVNANTVVNATAYPNSGYTFLHWGGDVSSTNNSIQFVVDKDMHVIAFFDYKHPPEDPKPGPVGNPILVD